MTDTPKNGFSRRDFATLGLSSVAAAGIEGQALGQTKSMSKPAIEPTRLVSADETLRPEIVGNFGIVAAGAKGEG